MAKELTFEEVDRHVNKYYKSAPRSLGTAKTISVDKLKSLYVVVRPILKLVASLPLLPTKWRSAITTFIGMLDLLTGTTA